jgi:MinD-like ATPase involved in chromosome partitioning or flagellar assembly
MAKDRYVILGLGRSRSPWFGNIALWTTSGAVPAEFHKCLSATHVRQRLSGLQPHSALIVEDGLAEIDRDLIESARRSHTPTIVISDSADADAWLDLGAVAVLPSDLSPATLLQTLAANTQIISDTRVEDSSAAIEHLTERQGRLVAVCGPGGTGASTVAIALAQALASDVTETDHVLLADLTRNSEQGMLHDSPDISPSIEEAVELHRFRRPGIEQIRELTFGVEQRGYRLLLGQRRIGAWTALPPSAIHSTLTGVRRAFRTVIADITADFESETDSGSIDVEERNALARLTVAQADVVFVVGNPGFKGIHALTRTLRQVVNAGAAAERVVPIVTRTSKKLVQRADVTKTISTIGRHGTPPMVWNAPVFLPDRAVENALRDGARLPRQLTNPLLTAYEGIVERIIATGNAIPFDQPEPQPITPGSLGSAELDRASGE